MSHRLHNLLGLRGRGKSLLKSRSRNGGTDGGRTITRPGWSGVSFLRRVWPSILIQPYSARGTALFIERGSNISDRGLLREKRTN
jgi:hypothetical protein